MKLNLPSRHWLLAAALAAAACAAQAQTSPRAGPFMVAAVGRSDYNYDCFIFADCSNARASSGRIGFGYRFGTFAVEGWWSDYGKGNTNDPGGSLRLQSLGASASWLMRFGEVAEGLLRAGLADTRYTRTRLGDRTTGSEFQPTFGLGIGFIVTPQISVELAWDVTRGDAPDTGTVLVNAASVGLRLRF